ncbi:MAG: hypothetical protein HUU20_07200 [Pirellulales bacterium]|nr:hypothetical protein [Pirellulales bacterium]
MTGSCLLLLLLSALAPEPSQSLLKNGGFETVAEARPGADGLVNGWKLGQPPQVPASWTPNPAYPGELSVPAPEAGKPAAHGGQRFVRISGPTRDAHLYQMCEGFDPAKWYRVSAWVRGGPVTFSFYEYFSTGKIGGQAVLQSIVGQGDWKRLEGFYRPPAEGYLRSALAISVPARQSADIDDVAIEPLDLPAVPTGADMVLETDAARIVLSSQGLLRELRVKPAGKDYVVEGTPVPILHVVHRGVATPLHSLSREGELIRARFLDPEVRATLRVVPRKQHIQFDVVDVQPADIEELTLRFPVRSLQTVAGAFNATYDDEFGMCLFGVTENTYQQTVPHGADIVGLAARCTKKHGIAGARFALVAAPRNAFEPAIMEAEKENGLPCPMLEGKWARVSEPVRRSYLFMVDAKESNIDQIIEYAKLGKFGMIIFLKDNWLATHGHFQINTNNFPDGVAGVKRAVDKIHAAGMGAGVHVFGPSISPNDPYIAPKPDDRLAFVPCPPLAEAVDEKSTVLVLAGVPDLPPKTGRSDAFPGYHIRIGDEIIRYQSVELGPTPRFVGCQRGALGTKAARHEKGAEVKCLLTMWSYFLVDPDSTLAEELTGNFAKVFNECDFDMAYFDASDGISDEYLDRWYYLNKMHLGYYRKFKKDVLYQTSNGTGSNLVWHIVPRSASADGHGDLKKYLDERLPGMLGMAANFTRPDVGWYYMFADVRPDQIEYVCAKTIGLDSSISIETSLATMDQHARARQMIEMVGRYEQCRLARHFPESVREQLREPGKDFKLLGDGGAWKLYRAVYEEPRYVESLDGKQNVWTIRNEQPSPCPLGVEIARGSRNVPTSDYDQPGAVTIETFDDAAAFRWDDESRAKRNFPGPDVVLSAGGAAKEGVKASLAATAEAARVGDRCAVLTATNTGPRGGWCAVARKLPKPLDLSRCQAIGLWVDGDGKDENLRLHLHDAAGRSAIFNVQVSFRGWRLCVFRTSAAAGFDWSKTDHLLLWVQGLAGDTTVRVGLDDLRGLPELHPAPPLVQPSVEVNGEKVVLPVQLDPMQALTSEGPGGIRFWPGGMQPGQAVQASAAVLMLQPGDNRITFSADATNGYPGDINVLLYRMWPMQ